MIQDVANTYVKYKAFPSQAGKEFANNLTSRTFLFIRKYFPRHQRLRSFEDYSSASEYLRILVNF